VEEQNRFSLAVGRCGQDGVVAVGMEATKDDGARGLIDAQTRAAQSDTTVGADSGLGALAPNVGPPRARRGRAKSGAVLAQGQLPGSPRGGGDFTVFFVLIAMLAKLQDQGIGRGDGGDGFGGKERGQALLPVVVETFDFALGLRGWSVAQGDLIEAQGGTELGEGLWARG